LDWEKSFAEKIIKLVDVKATSCEESVKAQLGPFFIELERKSLLENIDLLFQRCQRSAGWAPIGDYRYDVSELWH
jgi:hypothetical protein